MSKTDAFTQAGKTAVLQNIHGTVQFLQRFPPFNQMENAHLAYLVEQCQLRFYASGESIIKTGRRCCRSTSTSSSRVRWWANGRTVRAAGPKPRSRSPRASASRSPRLLGERATRTEHLAAEDTFCLQLNKQAFIKLVRAVHGVP